MNYIKKKDFLSNSDFTEKETLELLDLALKFKDDHFFKNIGNIPDLINIVLTKRM